MMNTAPRGSTMQVDQTSPGIDPSQGMNPIPQQAYSGTPKLPEQLDLHPDDKISPMSSIRHSLDSINLAEHLDEQKLQKISTYCLEGFNNDLQSRQQWEHQMEEWTKLAIQTREVKTYPWPKASNVKYPLLSTAAMQFAARAYPSLIPSDGQVVKSQVIGFDKDGQKTETAMRVSKYMSWQLLHEMHGWEEDMDKLLIMLPIVGTIFKKTYWDSIKQVNYSELVYPKNLVVDYWAKNLCDAERISEIIEMSPRILKERQLGKIFLDVDLGQAPQPNIDTLKDHNNAPPNDETTPFILIEQHTYCDLDDSDYPKPYIVTFHRESGKVLRIVPRFDEKSITHNKDGDVVRVEAIQYYTKFGFVPNPDGGFYDLGFGMLLGPLNEAVNSLINQLVDAGSLSNLQAGFLGKGLRIRMGDQRFQPGEWKSVNSTGDDLKKQIFPLPTREPSNVLFQLMGSLISSGKELASVAEIFVGKMPGQNTPATTTMATIEQGMKVFTAVYKRIFRSLGEEFKKLYRLNEVYLNPDTYAQVLDTSVNPSDFDSKNYNICPGADPTAVSQTEKLMKAQGLMELLPTGLLDPVAVVSRVLEAQEQPNWQQLLHQQVQQTGQPPAPPPDPKLQELQMKGQQMQQQAALQAQKAAEDSHYKEQDAQTKQAMASAEMARKAQESQAHIVIAAAQAEHTNKAKMAQGLQQAISSHIGTVQKVSQTEVQHQQKLRHQEEKHKLAQSQNKSSSTGNKTK